MLALRLWCWWCYWLPLAESQASVPRTSWGLFYLIHWKESESDVAQSCPTLCDPMDCSLWDSSIHGVFQARELEWVAISFSRGSSRPRNWMLISCFGRLILYQWATREAVKANVLRFCASPGNYRHFSLSGAQPVPQFLFSSVCLPASDHLRCFWWHCCIVCDFCFLFFLIGWTRLFWFAPADFSLCLTCFPVKR